MRIGIDATALPYRPVGAGTYIIYLIRALVALDVGHQFVVFAHLSGRDLVDLPPSAKLQWVVVPEKSPARRLVWEQVVFPFLIRKSSIDLLHSPHYTRPFFLSCASVVTFHDLTFFLYPQLHVWSKRLYFPWMMRMSAKRSNALIAASENTRQDAIRVLGVSPQKIISIPLGVSEEFKPITDNAALDECRRKYNLPEEFILYVGTIEPRKNLPLLIKAYSRLQTDVENAPSIVLAGRLGWKYEEVYRHIEQLGLKDKVLFTGYIPQQDLPFVYNLAGFFVYPSTYEGFGFPPLEAMACGKPVITTAISSMPEYVADAGILIPPGDEEALFQAMHRLVHDRTLRAMLSVKGPQQAASFGWDRTARATLEVYQRTAPMQKTT